MDMTGERVVAAPMDRVWQALNDPATIKSCVAGCESMESTGEHSYRMALAAKVGPISARFTGTVQMAEIEAPRAYTLRFDGSGGAAGFIKGEARVTLTPCTGGATTLTYVAKAQVGGKIAQVGSRLIDGAAQKVTGDFFARFAEVFPAASPTLPVAPASPMVIIRLALVVGVLMFGGVVALVHRPPVFSPSSIAATIFGYVETAGALGALALSLVMRRRVAAETDQAKRRGLLITSWAIAETPGLLGGVAFMLTGQWQWFAMGALAMGIAMLLSPIRS
jgi:carbon monoxide dehydrogenase subunit G